MLHLVAVSIVSCHTSAAEPSSRPNVVLFVADDHGADAGCYGNNVIKTPNIDALAREGTRYSRAFCTTASCSPSRSVILSGLFSHASGQYGLAHGTHHFASYSSVRSLPVILAEHGYRTARIGKFHVAPEEAYHFETILLTAQGSRNGVEMADNCRAFVADKTKPFFLYFCVTDPHRNQQFLDKPERPDSFGNNIKHPGVSEITYDPKDVIVPPWMPDTPASRAELAEYYQSVSRVDQGLGRVVALLKETGQYDNTLIIYTSDNGIAMPGAKTNLYDAGMRLPLVVRAPGAKVRGIVSSAMISWVDFTPTILDFAGVKEVLEPPLIAGEPESGLPKNPKLMQTKPYTFHGRSFRETIEKEKADGWDVVYGSHNFHEVTMYYPMRAIRTERYKLILNLAHDLEFPFAEDIWSGATWQQALKSNASFYGKRSMHDFLHRSRYELYDLQNDPDETVNLVSKPEMKAVFDDLAAKLKAFQTRTRDPWLLKYDHE